MRDLKVTQKCSRVPFARNQDQEWMCVCMHVCPCVHLHARLCQQGGEEVKAAMEEITKVPITGRWGLNGEIGSSATPCYFINQLYCPARVLPTSPPPFLSLYLSLPLSPSLPLFFFHEDSQYKTQIFSKILLLWKECKEHLVHWTLALSPGSA